MRPRRPRSRTTRACGTSPGFLRARRPARSSITPHGRTRPRCCATTTRAAISSCSTRSTSTMAIRIDTCSSARSTRGVFCQPRCAPSRRPAFRSRSSCCRRCARSSTRALSWRASISGASSMGCGRPRASSSATARRSTCCLSSRDRDRGAGGWKPMRRISDPIGKACRVLLAAGLMVLLPLEAIATTYYVRQTVGDDSHDGTSPETAWQHIRKLSAAMQAGDIAYVGPGLYRDQIIVLNDGAPDKRITFIADTTGQRTGDPPGIVMITGADPLDVSTLVPEGAPGVYKTPFSQSVLGLVEMDGDQSRYWRVKSRNELPLPEGVSEVDLVKQRPSSLYYDADAKMLYLHTSDGKPPSTHEMEYVDRDNGIGVRQKHYVTVMGFTIRHFADGGIAFYSADDGIAINNTSYGSRQGIRVYGSVHIAAYGNTLFRNENCGIYSALRSTNGLIIGNTMYENVKGIRWSSQSANGTAVDNAVFENHEYGISVENADHTLLRRNTLVNNEKGQLGAVQSDYSSDDSCFASGAPDQQIADLTFVGHYQALADYQRSQRQDLGSREGGCGPLPAKVDVHKLHEESKGYTARARRILNGAEASEAPKSAPPESAAGSWLKWLLGR